MARERQGDTTRTVGQRDRQTDKQTPKRRQRYKERDGGIVSGTDGQTDGQSTESQKANTKRAVFKNKTTQISCDRCAPLYALLTASRERVTGLQRLGLCLLCSAAAPACGCGSFSVTVCSLFAATVVSSCCCWYFMYFALVVVVVALALQSVCDCVTDCACAIPYTSTLYTPIRILYFGEFLEVPAVPPAANQLIFLAASITVATTADLK